MFKRLKELLKKKVETDIETPEIEIPVGGITDSGIVYEKEVKPQGNEPLYKEVHIDDKDRQEVKKTTTP